MGFRPGGSSSMTDTSKSPYKVMARVRGIGVAVITKIWGGMPLFFFHSLARWATPNRCCSSIITKPSLSKLTTSSIRAWVPINSCNSPDSSCSWMILRWLFLVEPVSKAMFTPNPWSIFSMVLKCWMARISVGAIRLAWKPLSKASKAIIKATRVLPLPTSPCKSRFICLPEPKSLRISLITFFWAPVSSNGRLLA